MKPRNFVDEFKESCKRIFNNVGKYVTYLGVLVGIIWYCEDKLHINKWISISVLFGIALVLFIISFCFALIKRLVDNTKLKNENKKLKKEIKDIKTREQK